MGEKNLTLLLGRLVFPTLIFKSSKLSLLSCDSNLIYLTLTSTWELVMVISDPVLVFGKDKRMGAGRGNGKSVNEIE